MTDAIKRTCPFLLLLGASTCFAQSTTTSGQKTSVKPTNTTSDTHGLSITASPSTMTPMSGDPATETNIQKMEQELRQAVKTHDTVPFTKYIDDNIIVFGAAGWKALGKAEVLQGVKSNPCTLDNTAMSDFAYKWISRDAVLVTYTLTEDRICQGKTAATKEYFSSLWHKTGGTWTTNFHQETTVKTMTAAGPPQS
jgi:hypothetical protein